MKLTKKLKLWAVKELGVSRKADDAEFKKAISEALVEGTLSPSKLKRLSTTEEDEKATNTVNTLKSVAGGLAEIRNLLVADSSKVEEADEKGVTDDIANKEVDEKKTTQVKGGHKSFLSKMVASMSSASLIDDETGEEKAFDIRVKEAADQYSNTKSALTYPMQTEKGRQHPFAGQPVMDFSEGSARQIESASELDKAVAGAFAKYVIQVAQKKSRQLAFNSMPQHDRELLGYAVENMKWGGCGPDATDLNYADIKNRRLTPSEQKALFDDATSGGIEAAPIVFDDQIIQTPLLNGELFPLVNVVPLERGRRVEGVSTGTVTGGWGGVDDTAIDLFDTTSYVSAFDTTIYRWDGAIRIGLDFMSDTPIDFGQHITQQYGERLLEDLDDVIATGNGTTQPEGVMNKSGTTSVNFAGATSLGNYESLRFGVAKAEHKANLLKTAVFCGNETSYTRARAIPVGASDARRLGGMDYSSYKWMERDYKINESLENTEIFYAILGRYRMYRRRGLTMRSSTEGDTLIRRNEMLMVATARFGGQLERGAVAAKTSTAPA
jgi:HK97 family phage major capsid protein